MKYLMCWLVLQLVEFQHQLLSVITILHLISFIIIITKFKGTQDGKTPVARGSEIPQFFEENGNTIFNSSKMVALWNNLRDKSKYDPAGIESILKK